MEQTFTGKNDKELEAAVAMWLAQALAKRAKEDKPDIEPQHGGGGGP